MNNRHLVTSPEGGQVYQLDDYGLVKRWLVTGSFQGTMYDSAEELTKDAGNAFLRLYRAAPLLALNLVVEVSQAGKAVKNDPALFALALMLVYARDESIRQQVGDRVGAIARIGTHLFQLIGFVKQLGGLHFEHPARLTLAEAVTNWKDTDTELAFQMVKYRARENWNWGQMLDLLHPKPERFTQSACFWYANWVTRRERRLPELDAPNTETLPASTIVRVGPRDSGVHERVTWAKDLPIIAVYEQLRVEREISRVVSLIHEHRLPWEVIPTELLGEPAVLEALLPYMGLWATVRQLAKYTAAGVLKPGSFWARTLAERIADRNAIVRARLHPLKFLDALYVYNQGFGVKGSLQWSPVAEIVQALEAGFYASFDAIEPSCTSLLIALDVSGSMSFQRIPGSSVLTPRDAAACLAMVTARTEPRHEIVGFSQKLVTLPIQAHHRLADVLAITDRTPMGGTDCSAPIRYAMAYGMHDAFAIYTDSESGHTGKSPAELLREYRQRWNKPEARFVNVQMNGGSRTLADPTDAGMFDQIGFSPDTPAILSMFIAGEI